VALLWFLGGWVGLLVGLAIVAWDRLRRPPATDLLRAALAGFCLLPLAVVARGLPRPSTVTPLFAGSNLVAHYLAGAALALLVIGILRDVPVARRHAGPGDGPAGGEGPAAATAPQAPGRQAEPAPGAPAGNGPRPGRRPTPPAIPVPPPWGPGREYQPPHGGPGPATPPGQPAADRAAREADPPPATPPRQPSGDGAAR
jgi:hypothetical protein